MLRVKTYLALSTIPDIGIGLFADETISKGAVVWEFVDGLDQVLTWQDIHSMDKSDKEFVEKYGYLRKQPGTKDVYVLCLDNARFMNHSESPNVIDNPDVYGIDGKTVAGKTIQKGEEILCDYFGFDANAEEKLKIK